MALTAGSLIDSAEKRTFAAIGRQRISRAALVDSLSFYDQQIVQMIAQEAPDLLATISGSITLTDSGNLNGYTLASGLHYRDFTHINGDTYTPFKILRREYRDSGAAPAGMLRVVGSSGLFYPIDPLRKRWSGSEIRQWFEPDESHSVSYSYVPLPAQLTSESSTLGSPDLAREVLVVALELAILLSVPKPVNDVASQQYQMRIQDVTARHAQGFSSLRMQVAKLVHPAGSPGPAQRRESAVQWITDQIGG